MGQSTDAILAYGCAVEDGERLPWMEEDDGYGDFDEWWRNLKGFNEPYPHKNLQGEERQAALSVYFEKRREWDKHNPPPIEVIRHCHHEYPMWFIALPNTAIVAHRGYPQIIGSDKQRDVSSAEEDAACAFFDKHLSDVRFINECFEWVLMSDWS